jgi:hypothetical protein
MKKTANTDIRFDESQMEYIVELKRRRKYWWLLLLLLPILLFINLEKDITVQVFDRNEQPVSGAQVDFDFVSSHLYKRGEFFLNDTLSKSEVTGADGICTFRDCPYSIYGMIFKMFHKSRLYVFSDCIVPVEAKHFYYYLFGKHTLYVGKEAVEITVKVLDKEDNEPINEATVHYSYRDIDNRTITDSARTNPAGYIVIKGVNKCEEIDYLRGSCYGYNDDKKETLNVVECIKDPSKTVLQLEPIKESIEFFVTSCNTKQPLPDAKATVTVSSPQKSKTYNVSTNTDGRGRAYWPGFHILSEISIIASKPGFKDGSLPKKYTVEQFIKLSDEQRTICLDPNPCTIEFVNVDSLTQKGLKGVKNEITLTSASRVNNLTEFSGSNGVFSIEVLDGDNVDIASDKSPDYYPARKHFNFTDLSKRNIIYMQPKDTVIIFRVLDEKDRFCVQTVSDVHLRSYQIGVKMGDSIFRKVPPSVHSTYSIEVYYPYDLTIEASANGYKDNDYQIKNTPVKDLLADASKCDILMEPLPLVCTGQTYSKKYVSDNNDEYSLLEYDMSGYLGEFLFEYDTHTRPDTIVVYDATKNQRNTSNQIFYYGHGNTTNGMKRARLQFKSPVITVEVFGRSSAWKYKISCP